MKYYYSVDDGYLPNYKEKEMINQASDDLCKALEATDDKTAELACRKYLTKRGYTVARFT